MSLKIVQWRGSSKRTVRAFPHEARQVVGFQLYRVQQGLDPNDWKPMPTVGSGVKEIRVRTGRDFRVVYTAKLASAVYVLHAFEKKSQRTPKRDLEIARRRLRELLEKERGENGPKE